MQGMGRFGSILGSAVGGILLGMGWGFAGIVSALAIPAGIAAVAILASRVASKRVPSVTEALAQS
jgi:AAHS family 4-hydroxybenzoate transporter-like MFS transporter